MALLRRHRQYRVLLVRQLQLVKKTDRRVLVVHEMRRTISMRPLRTLSSWGTTSIPWLRYQQESPAVDLERLRKQEAVRRKWKELEGSLHNVVRKYCQETAFPKEFGITSRQELWGSTTSPTASLSKKSPSSSPSRPAPTASKRKLSSAGKRLLAFNGFEPVPLPKSKDVLDLAEGVVIKPAPPKEIKGYVLYVQLEEQKQYKDDNRPNDAKSNNEKREREFPVFIEEDHTLYRVLENQAAVFLDHQYSALRKFFKVYIDEPSKRVAARVESGALYNLLLDQPKPASESNKPVLDGANSDDNDDTIRHLTPSSNLQPGEEQEPHEGLLVMSYDTDELTFYEHMRPSTRIAALPNVMSHNSASTLVHVSLVVFGALPLAYRSYVFALNYGYAQSIATSVALTIAYGIWSHRVSARTNQSRVVTNALLHRVHARDDAVVFVLQEGAVRKLTRAILHEYYQQTLKSGNADTTLMDGSFLATGDPTSSLEETESINPEELATKLGLLVATESKDGDKEVVAVSLEEALTSLKSSTLSL